MWHTVNYEARGRSHQRTNTPCQDKTLAKYINGIYLLGLADGAGSAKYSHYGAEITLKASSEYLSNNFSLLINSSGDEVRKNILAYILEQLNLEAQQLNCTVADLASTLLFLAIDKENFIMLHIGDGVIGFRKNGELKVASKPDNGEFSNTTIFVTSKNAISHMKLFKGSTDNISGFVFMSDGCATSFYHKKSSQLAPVLAKIMYKTSLHPDTIKKDIMHSFPLILNNTQDDCSIAIISRLKEPLNSYISSSIYHKIKILQLRNNASAKRIIKQYDLIIKICEEAKTLQEIQFKIPLRKKYLLKRINKLCKLGLLNKINNKICIPQNF